MSEIKWYPQMVLRTQPKPPFPAARLARSFYLLLCPTDRLPKLILFQPYWYFSISFLATHTPLADA